MKELLTSMASVVGVLVFFQSFLQTLLPPELRTAAAALFLRLFRCFSSYSYFDITEIDGVNTNELYSAVQLYLSSSPTVTGGRRSLSRAVNASSVTFGISSNDRLVDNFNGAVAVWEHVVSQRQPQSFSWRPVPDEKRFFTLRLKKQKNHELVLAQYLDHIMDRAAEIRRRSQERLLYTNARGGTLDARGGPWDCVPFKHPSTFETLAMEPSKKAEIMADLKDFAAGQAFYQRTGRAWKRGYLLYGSPGTGKSSMIAAMANFLNYDIYDLELTEVYTNSELRKLLMKTTSKSIIVIEDIDCSLTLTNRSTNRPRRIPTTPPPCSGELEEHTAARSITLSGLLNFTDGLWSCCGSERIFVFTTNHVEKLDPALLRSGRMDMHIHMSYCTFNSLKILMRNYWGFEDEEFGDEDNVMIMKEIEEAVGSAEITPADVSEVLIKNRRKEKKEAMEKLLEALRAQAAARKVAGAGGGGRLSLMKEEFDEEEEQEKRALESPKNNGEEAMEVCNGNKEKDEQV